MPDKDKPPMHPVEVRIAIGGDDWDYVRKALAEIAGELGISSFTMCSIGGGESYLATASQSDLSAEQYRKELKEWSERNRS